MKLMNKGVKSILIIIISLSFIIVSSCAFMKKGIEKDTFKAGVKISSGITFKNNRGLAKKIYPALNDIENFIEDGKVIKLGNLDSYIKERIIKLNLSYEEQVIVGELILILKVGLMEFVKENYPDIIPSEYLIQVKEVIGWIKEAANYYIEN